MSARVARPSALGQEQSLPAPVHIDPLASNRSALRAFIGCNAFRDQLFNDCFGQFINFRFVKPDIHFDIRQFQLSDPAERALVANADFSSGTAHWFPSAGSYFLPWHIDNLYLELLIERGLAGLLLFAALLAATFARFVTADPQLRQRLAIVASALLGALLLGLVSSVLDTPRVAFLLFFLILLGIQLTSVKRPV